MRRRNNTIRRIILLAVCLIADCAKEKSGRWDYSAWDNSAITIEDSNTVKIENFKIVDRTLSFSYIIKNNFDRDIWVCDDIDIRSGYDFDTRLDEKAVYVRFRRDLPSNVLLYQTIVCRYIRLAPGKLIERQVTIELPVVTRSPVYSIDRRNVAEVEPRTELVFEVGYFIGDLTGASGVAKHVSVDEVYLDFFDWEGKSKEKVFTAKISNLRIPCLYYPDTGLHASNN